MENWWIINCGACLVVDYYSQLIRDTRGWSWKATHYPQRLSLMNNYRSAGLCLDSVLQNGGSDGEGTSKQSQNDRFWDGNQGMCCLEVTQYGFKATPLLLLDTKATIYQQCVFSTLKRFRAPPNNHHLRLLAPWKFLATASPWSTAGCSPLWPPGSSHELRRLAGGHRHGACDADSCRWMTPGWMVGDQPLVGSTTGGINNWWDEQLVGWATELVNSWTSTVG